MKAPTGKLKFAYETIANMDAIIKELKNEIVTLKKPDIYWLIDDPENGTDNPHNLISEFIDDDIIGTIVEFEVARRLPNIKVKILPFNEHGGVEIEYL